MDDFEQESINEELIEFAIQESIQDAHKAPCSTHSNRKTSNSEAFLKIMAAIHKGDVNTLKELSSCASAFRESDSRGHLPLHTAALQPHQDVLRAVLDAMTSLDLTLEEITEDGDTALTLAAEADLVDNVVILLQHGASPHNTNSRNESPLLIDNPQNPSQVGISGSIQSFTSAVRQRSYDMVSFLITGGAFVEQVCLSKWTATHEAAKVGCPAILMLLIRHGAKVSSKDGHGVTPLGVAAEHGNTEALDIFIKQGGDVNAKACNGDTVLYDAVVSGNLDTVKLLLLHGANPNVASYAFQLPIHRATYEGHILILRTLIPITTKRAIRLSGQNPVHSAADSGQAECLRLLIQEGYDVNSLLGTHISENYGDLRKTPLYFAISNGDATCAEMLLAAGARTDLDPLRCILVAIRAQRYDLVELLLSYGAEVNCYFKAISNTLFPTALQYCLGDRVMLRLLLNSGYHAHKCFQCCHGNQGDIDSTWADLQNQLYRVYCQYDTITFCEFVSVSWLKHVIGGVVKVLLDYVGHVNICPNLEVILRRTPEWDDIFHILSEPRPLQHLCRLVIRSHMSLRALNNPQAMAAVPFPPALKNYVTYRNYDQCSDPFST